MGRKKGLECLLLLKGNSGLECSLDNKPGWEADERAWKANKKEANAQVCQGPEGNPSGRTQTLFSPARKTQL